MGTTALVANSTIRLSPGWKAIFYWGVWAIYIIGIGVILWAALKSKRWARWTTQDVLIVAALGVLLEVYDNIVGDQIIGPLINPIPGAHFIQIHDLPYMPGLAELMYDEWKTSPLTMVPYPDTPPVLKAFSGAGLPIGIVSNTGWSIDWGYAVTGLDAFIATFVLSCDRASPSPRRSRS
jgi:hypothetical protein